VTGTPLTAAVANLLMADGSVKTLFDTNGDKFFNPGFDAPRH
jgi:prepilin-type processing-associated H-X9-DG protein